MLDQFNTILEKQQEERLISFLQSLNSDQRKELSPAIKKLTKYYNEYSNDGSGTYKHKGSSVQLEMLQIASFVCLSMTDYEKSPFSIWFLEGRSLGKIIGWFCPDWFSDFVNKQANLDNIPYYINYSRIMELTEKRYLHPTKDLLAKTMPQMIFEQDKDRNWVFKPENLLKRNITIDEHIWYLFEVETNLHYSDRFLHFGKDVSKEKIGWHTLFKQYSEEKRIDRFRLLKESLLASNRNFNKVLSGWFIELFNQLEPTKEDILSLQSEMFTVLGSPHSKPVGIVLQYFKKVLTDKKFKTGIFLDNTPVLLSSSTKSVVMSTLMILEKLAAKNKEVGAMVSRLVMQVFIHSDDELQARAARIIADNQAISDDSFKEELSVYFPTMMLSAKKLLKDFDNTVTELKPIGSVHTPIVETRTEWVEMASVENIDDLVFLASQAFDNNQSWHIDFLPAAVIQLQSQLRGGNIDKMEPALQRALKMIGSDFRSTQGHLDHMLAVFFIDVCVLLTKKYPDESNALRLLFGKFDQKEGDKVSQWLAIGDDTSYLASWDNYYHDPYYLPYKQLLLSALEKIRKQNVLPLLSTPTHEPGWILPDTLIKRLLLYQQANVNPGNMDFQIAISRCLLEKTENAIESAKKQLTDEYRSLMLFLLDNDATPKEPFKYEAVWLVASLSKKEKKIYPAFEKFHYSKTQFEHYTGQFLWESVDEEYTYNRYDYQLQKEIPVKNRRKTIRINFNNHVPKENKSISKLLSKLIPQTRNDQPLLYDFLKIKTSYFERQDNDIRRILLLTPNNPEVFLSQIVHRCLNDPTFSGESDKRMVIAALQTLHEIWNHYGNMAHLFLGTCMLASDKTVINIAGEIWLKAVTTSRIENKQLGKVIGLHERIEFAPLKRFTDLISQSMFRVSPIHDQQLRILIGHILLELPDKPIKNLKKLLEIYAEVLAINQSRETDEKLIDRFVKWNSSASLKKIIDRLEETRGSVQ